jgi:H+/Cl- antiporter ClcA
VSFYPNSLCSLLLPLYLAVVTGFLAGCIDIGVDWLADTRFGYCTVGGFVDSKLCCSAADDSTEIDQVFITVLSLARSTTTVPITLTLSDLVLSSSVWLGYPGAKQWESRIKMSECLLIICFTLFSARPLPALLHGLWSTFRHGLLDRVFQK